MLLMSSEEPLPIGQVDPDPVAISESASPAPLPPEIWAELHPAVKELILSLLEANKALRARVDALEERLRTNSTNSSKPPSSDPPGVARRRKGRSKRRRGGQKGHPGHFRELLPVEQVDRLEAYYPTRCECCGRGLDPVPEGPPIRHQVSELPPPRVEVTEHQRHHVRCPDCQHVSTAPHPNGVPTGVVGPRLMAVDALLTTRFRMSRRDCELFNELVFGMKCALGTVTRVEVTVSQAVAPAVEEVAQYVQQCPVLGMDETPWKETSKKAYLWNANTPEVAFYKIAAHRDTATAKKIVGDDFGGALITDRLPSYDFQEDKKRQHCLSHLDRDFEKIAERGGESQMIGEWGQRELDNTFALHHRFKRNEIDRGQMQQELGPIRARMGRLLRRGECLDHDGQEEKHRKTARTCAKIRKKFDCLWVFAYVEGVEPTNNSSERAVRPGVRLRRVSFGSQSKAGSRYVERMLTVVETCRRQGRNVLTFVVGCVEALLNDTQGPSLLPAPG
ncbi:MAG: IS66 family transposase [Candidatus Hydrogenedentes bacterium]|nr:IS66 family transposase [Candidatus Hydrogenedentota bacterium]